MYWAAVNRHSATVIPLQADNPEDICRKRDIQCSKENCADISPESSNREALAWFCCCRDGSENDGLLDTLMSVYQEGKDIFDAVEFVMQIKENAKLQEMGRTAAKRAFVLSSGIEIVYFIYDVNSAYVEMQQDISQLQEEEEWDLDNKQKQVKDKFKKTVVARSVSGVGAVAGSTVGAVIGTHICPGVGTWIGGMVGNYVGRSLSSRAGEAMGEAMFGQ